MAGFTSNQSSLWNHAKQVSNFTNATTKADKYDSVGAMQYIICVITVYAFLGVFCLVVDRFRFRRPKFWHSDPKFQSDAIRKYLKSEKSLKLQGYKMKLLTEIERQSESIKQFEEKLRLIEIETDVKAEDFSLNPKAKRKLKRKMEKERRKLIASLDETGTKELYSRKLSQTYAGEKLKVPGHRRFSASAALNLVKSKKKRERRASTMDTVGKMGFSFLFMDATRALREETEETDSEGSSGDPTDPSKLTVRNRDIVDNEAENLTESKFDRLERQYKISDKTADVEERSPSSIRDDTVEMKRNLNDWQEEDKTNISWNGGTENKLLNSPETSSSKLHSPFEHEDRNKEHIVDMDAIPFVDE